MRGSSPASPGHRPERGGGSSGAARGVLTPRRSRSSASSVRKPSSSSLVPALKTSLVQPPSAGGGASALASRSTSAASASRIWARSQPALRATHSAASAKGGAGRPAPARWSARISSIRASALPALTVAACSMLVHKASRDRAVVAARVTRRVRSPKASGRSTGPSMPPIRNSPRMPASARGTLTAPSSACPPAVSITIRAIAWHRDDERTSDFTRVGVRCLPLERIPFVSLDGHARA